MQPVALIPVKKSFETQVCKLILNYVANLLQFNKHSFENIFKTGKSAKANPAEVCARKLNLSIPN